MTTKQQNNITRAAWGLGITLSGALIIWLFAYAYSGVVAGNRSGEKIEAVKKTIDEHITCHHIFEKTIDDKLKEIAQQKADKELVYQLFDRLGSVESLLMSNNKLLKVEYKNNRSATYGGGGMHYDTLKH